MSHLQQEIAQALLNIGAVGFKPDKPITFVTGLKSPVYVDNRRFPFYPAEWQKVLAGFQHVIREQHLEFDVVAGIATAGIPHSAALGLLLEKPSVFIRKEAKGHGKKKLIEGGEVAGKRVLLIEDLVTTGSSSLAGVTQLREAGATVMDCLIIISYGFEEARKAFEKAGVQLHALTTFPVVLDEAVERKICPEKDKAKVADWLADPHGWAEKYKVV